MSHEQFRKIWFGKLAEEQHWQVGLEKMGSPFFIFCSSAQNDSYLGFIGSALARLLLQFTCKTSCFVANSLKSSMILQNGFQYFLRLKHVDTNFQRYTQRYNIIKLFTRWLQNWICGKYPPFTRAGSSFSQGFVAGNFVNFIFI